MNAAMKWVSRPAYIGWTLLGVWIATLRLRLHLLAEKKQIAV
jgi:heme exporter protein C